MNNLCLFINKEANIIKINLNDVKDILNIIFQNQMKYLKLIYFVFTREVTSIYIYMSLL